MSGGRIVDPFKMSRFIKRVLELMESEGLNLAEAEAAPKMIKSAVEQNSEWQKKAKPFTVYK